MRKLSRILAWLARVVAVAAVAAVLEEVVQDWIKTQQGAPAA